MFPGGYDTNETIMSTGLQENVIYVSFFSRLLFQSTIAENSSVNK